jgi:hypothetical protein
MLQCINTADIGGFYNCTYNNSTHNSQHNMLISEGNDQDIINADLATK